MVSFNAPSVLPLRHPVFRYVPYRKRVELYSIGTEFTGVQVCLRNDFDDKSPAVVVTAVGAWLLSRGRAWPSGIDRCARSIWLWIEA